MNASVETSSSEHGHAQHSEIAGAIRNAIKMGSSLALTWGIALVVRLYVPRKLGPDRFGLLNFAEAFTSASFVLLGLGVETYIRREISVRREHAKDFISTLVLTRIAMTVLVFGVMEAILRATGRSDEARLLVHIYGVSQFFIWGSLTSSALLQSVGRVNEMSILSIVTKVLWAAGLFLALFLNWPLWAYAVVFMLAEGLKSSSLFYYARKELDLGFGFRFAALKPILLEMFPFYLSAIASTIYNRIDVSMISVMGSDREAGYYGAAVGLAGLTMLLAPLINWVLIPVFSRAHARSPQEFSAIVHRSQEFIFGLSLPVGVIMVAGSHLWIGFVFGPSYAPANLAMKFLAVAHLLMYVSIVCSCALTLTRVVWPMTWVFLAGLLINPALNYFLIPYGMRTFGPGGPGAMAGLATLLTEGVISLSLVYLLGRDGYDRRLLRSVGIGTAAAVSVIAIDEVLPGERGWLRLSLVCLGYLAIVVPTRALDVPGIIHWVKAALRRPKSSDSAPAAA